MEGKKISSLFELPKCFSVPDLSHRLTDWREVKCLKLSRILRIGIQASQTGVQGVIVGCTGCLPCRQLAQVEAMTTHLVH